MQTLGRYQLLDRLGAGAFATVYRARDPLARREVALKILYRHLAENDELYRRFLAEARAMALLRHPNIAAFYDIDAADGCPFIAMELIDGQTLADLVAAQGRLTLDWLLDKLPGLCSAIDFLHAAGWVHRDIKASNVMLDRRGRVVLMDFGIIRGLEDTLTHTRPGTPESMAPEQVRGEVVSPAADIYALGVLIYRLLAGRLPFVGDEYQVMYAHVNSPPPPLRTFRPDLPEHVSRAVDRALAKDPKQRPASASALLEALARRRRARTEHPTLVTLAGPADWAGCWSSRATEEWAFDGPYKVAVDSAGNVYASGTWGPALRYYGICGIYSISPDGTVGQLAIGRIGDKQLIGPHELTIDMTGCVHSFRCGFVGSQIPSPDSWIRRDMGVRPWTMRDGSTSCSVTGGRELSNLADSQDCAVGRARDCRERRGTVSRRHRPDKHDGARRRRHLRAVPEAALSLGHSQRR